MNPQNASSAPPEHARGGTVHLRAPAFFDTVGAHMDHSAEPASSNLRPGRVCCRALCRTADAGRQPLPTVAS
jgi:hypothetical protein